jgi:hypothetical protein
VTPTSDPADGWLAALEERHLADLTPSEVARALRALSSCYVERRGKLASGGALDGAGKRAAFALFYAPVHFLTVRHIVRAIGAPALKVKDIVDLGCGTGAAGAAWALEVLPPEQLPRPEPVRPPEGGSYRGKRTRVRVNGMDRHPWAVAEANWTYRQLGVAGRAMQADITRTPLRAGRDTGVSAAYALNELAHDARERLLGELGLAHERGACVLIVEPIARRMAAWWDEWAERCAARGGRSDQWRFRADLPPRQRDLAGAAGLDPRELTARSLFVPPKVFG